MALIKCPECGQQISDKANSCPNCGCPREVLKDIDDLEKKKNTTRINKNAKIILIIVIVVVAIIILSFVLRNYAKCEHEYDTGKITKEASCTETGEKTYTCSLCEETKVETIAKKPHKYNDEITKESTFEEAGEKTFICEYCGDSYTESIPVRDDKVVVTVTNKINLQKDSEAGRYSDRSELKFDVMNRTDQAIKGVQGKLEVCDLFGENILTINCDFVGNIIPAGETIAVNDLGIDINQFLDSHLKFYNSDFSDLKFGYKVTNIVYDDGSSMKEQPLVESMESQYVTVNVTNKKNLDIDYNSGRYLPRVEFDFEVYNNTSRDIKGVQGILKIKDLFGVDIMSSSLDFTGQIIGANSSINVSEMGIEINQFQDEHIKIYNTNFDDLKFEYEVTSIIYVDDANQNGEEKEDNEGDQVKRNDDKAEESSNTKTESGSMTAEQAMQWLNGSWDAGDGITYNFNLNADGTLAIPAVGSFWSNYSSGTWSCNGNTIVMTGFRDESSSMGFGYIDAEFKVVRKGENTASIEGITYVSGHEAEVPPSSTVKMMNRM